MKQKIYLIILTFSLCMVLGCKNNDNFESTERSESENTQIAEVLDKTEIEENEIKGTEISEAETNKIEVTQTEVKEADELYSDFIEKIRSGFADNFQTVTTDELDISFMFRYASETMGYYIVDLDSDGTEELILGENGEGAWNNIIYDIYTVKDGEIVHVVDGWDRNRYYLCDKGKGVLANEGSSGASNSVYAYYRYNDGDVELIEAVIYDGWKDEENPWFYSNESTNSKEASPMFEDAAREIIDSYTHKEIEFVKFLEQ